MNCFPAYTVPHLCHLHEVFNLNGDGFSEFWPESSHNLEAWVLAMDLQAQEVNLITAGNDLSKAAGWHVAQISITSITE